MNEVFKPAPLPLDEIDRLRALDSYYILDTQDEVAFDELTALGAFTFKVPLCLITLVRKDTQFFKSAFGTEMRHASRDESFCSYALLEDEPLVILDSLNDERFAKSPHVLGGPKIRFYAGMPLVEPSGHKIGTFCLYDVVPKEAFGPEEIAAIKRFAVLAFQLIEQRLLPMRLRRQEEEALVAARHASLILESTSDSVLLVGEDWKITFLNQNAFKGFAQIRNLLGEDLWTAFPSLAGTIFETAFRQASAEKKMVSFEGPCEHLLRYFEVHVHPSGNGLAIFFRDITERKMHQESLRRLEERYHIAALAASEGIWDFNQITREAYYSAEFQRILGLQPEEFTGTISDFLDRLCPRDRLRATGEINAWKEGTQSDFRGEYRIRHADGGWRWVRNRGRIVRDESGTILRIAGSMRDITDQLLIDPTTGSLNRRSLMEHVEDGMEDPFDPSCPLGLLIVDLKSFSRINDSFGQEVGDKVLTEVTRRLESTLGTDGKSIVARVGEKEFAILLRGLPEKADFLTYINCILAILSRPILCGASRPISVTASVGVAIDDGEYPNPEMFLEAARVAVHEARVLGNAQPVIFEKHMRVDAQLTAHLQADLQHAVEDGQFVMHYQPKVLLETAQICGIEALVRWVHPELGIIPPTQFIPLAEESGQIIEIGYWILRQSLRQLSKWRSTVSPNLTISVNLSPKQFDDPNLVDMILDILAEEGALPGHLSLEITEGALIGNIDSAVGGLSQLRTAGIGLELDDFGTGYSSLSYLRQLPFDTLKIDQSFVRSMTDSPETQAIVKSIIQLGRSLSLKVIAEGIETVEQRNYLFNMDCTLGQGHLYAKAMDADEMTMVLEDEKEVYFEKPLLSKVYESARIFHDSV